MNVLGEDSAAPATVPASLESKDKGKGKTMQFICGSCKQRVQFQSGVSDFIRCACGKVNYVANTAPKNKEKKKKKKRGFLRSIFGGSKPKEDEADNEKERLEKL